MFLCLSLSVLIITVYHLQYLLSVKPFYSLPLLPVQSPALCCLFAFGTSSWSSLTLDGVTVNSLLWKGIKNPVGMAITWIFWGSVMTEQWSWGSCKQRLQSGPAYWFSSTMAALNFSSTWHHTIPLRHPETWHYADCNLKVRSKHMDKGKEKKLIVGVKQR